TPPQVITNPMNAPSTNQPILQSNHVEEDPITPITDVSVPDKQELQQILKIAEFQAKRDLELNKYKKTIRTLMEKLEEKENFEKKITQKIDELERSKKRENANLEYLKNIFVKFLSSEEIDVQQRLLNV